MRNVYLCLTFLSAVSVSAQTFEFPDVMRRAHAYVVEYEDHQLSSVVAAEHYHQQWLEHSGGRKAERTLRSEFLIFQLPPEEDWFALRDVHHVDESPVIDRADMFDRLCARSSTGGNERAMEIAKESARFNLGDVYRTINLPTYALRFLRPASRSRFRFKKAAEVRFEGMTTWVVSYEETGRPTFSATVDGDDLAAHGRFWIEPETGAVLRSEMIVGGTRRVRDRATITVTYAQTPSVGFRVPVEMQERYDRPRQRTADLVVGVARYSDFRRIDLRTVIPPEAAARAGDAGLANPLRPCVGRAPAN